MGKKSQSLDHILWPLPGLQLRITESFPTVTARRKKCLADSPPLKISLGGGLIHKLGIAIINNNNSKTL